MTRDEAIAKMYGGMGYVSDDMDIKRRVVGQQVDGLAALGLLKLDEPKTPEDDAVDALHGHRVNGNYIRKLDAVDIIITLQSHGLRIVKAEA